MVSVAVSVSLFSASSSFADLIPGSSFNYGNWYGNAFTNDATGDFSHCAVSASYNSGDTLYFTINSNVTVSVAVSNPTLNLTPNQSFPVSLTVDRRHKFFGTATAISREMATLTIDDFANAMEALQRGRTLIIESPAGNGVYDLSGTFRALEAAKVCALSNFTKRSEPVTAANTTNADQTMLFQIATGMIADLEVKDSQYMSAEEIQSALGLHQGVFWHSNERALTGGVVVASNAGGAPLQETDAADLAFLAQGCKGEIATTSRALKHEGLDARELRVMCVTDQHTSEAVSTKMNLGDSILYSILVSERTASTAENEARSAMNDGVALRAASYVKGQ